MEMSGERTIAADRAAVWAALNDPEVLKACIPGCQEIEKTSDTEFSATVKQKVGPVSATFKGAVTLSDMVPPESYRISGEGKGGAAGFAKGGAHVRLEEVEEGTRLTYEAEAKVGGKLAQLGGRLIDGFAKKMADQFFDSFKAQVEGPAEETPAADAPQPAAEAAEAGSGAAAEPAGASGGRSDAQPAGGSTVPPAAQPAAEAAPAKKKSWFSRLIGS